MFTESTLGSPSLRVREVWWERLVGEVTEQSHCEESVELGPGLPGGEGQEGLDVSLTC